MQQEKRLIGIFKSFIEKALIPQIKKMQGSLFEWNKFNSMTSSDAINYNELQAYVDSLSTPPSDLSMNSNAPKDQFSSYFKKKRQDTQQQKDTSPINNGFNPSKTFGGSRARMNIPGLKNDFDDFQYKKEGKNTKQDFKKINPQSLLPGIERLAKMFAETQSKIDSMPQFNGTSGNSPFNNRQKEGFYQGA